MKQLLEILVTRIRIKRSGFKSQLAKLWGKSFSQVLFLHVPGGTALPVLHTKQVVSLRKERGGERGSCGAVKSNSVVMGPTCWPFSTFFGGVGVGKNSWQQGKRMQQTLNLTSTDSFFECSPSSLRIPLFISVCSPPPLPPQHQFQTLLSSSPSPAPPFLVSVHRLLPSFAGATLKLPQPPSGSASLYPFPSHFLSRSRKRWTVFYLISNFASPVISYLPLVLFFSPYLDLLHSQKTLSSVSYVVCFLLLLLFSFSLMKFLRVIWVLPFIIIHAFLWYISIWFLCVSYWNSCLRSHQWSHGQIQWPLLCLLPLVSMQSSMRTSTASPLLITDLSLSGFSVSVHSLFSSLTALLFSLAPKGRCSLECCTKLTQYRDIHSNWVEDLNINLYL